MRSIAAHGLWWLRHELKKYIDKYYNDISFTRECSEK